jgi:hypothetical protein
MLGSRPERPPASAIKQIREPVPSGEILFAFRCRGRTQGACAIAPFSVNRPRLFEQLKLDINLTTEDPRPVEIVEVKSNPFAFMEGALRLPMISSAQQLAEKLRAYSQVCSRRELSPERHIRHARDRTGG